MSELISLNVAVSPVEKLREYLATKGQRLTAEREKIVEEVFASHQHFDAEDLIARLSRRVSRSTVYRCLSLLVEAGLIRPIARQDDRELYEHDYGYPQHDHLICSRCGNLTEFRNEEISRILDVIAIDHSFRMEAHRLEVYGLCHNCSRPPDTRHQKLNLL
jgi:Fur family ferric uptake transcriptional regulator